MWWLVFVTSTVTLFVLPLLPALLEWRGKLDVTPLDIDPADKVDIDYLARNFMAFVKAEMSGSEKSYSGAGCLQNSEEGDRPQLEKLLHQWRETRRLPTAPVLNNQREDDFHLKIGAFCGTSNRLHGVFATRNLVLGQKSSISLWAHAKTVQAGRQCTLSGRVSADEMILLDTGCHFERINANIVWFGARPAEWPQACNPSAEDEARTPHDLRAVSDLTNFGRWMVDHDLDFSQPLPFYGDIVVQGNATLRSGSEIRGSVKCYGKMKVEAGARINGALISQQTMVIGTNCRIAGPVVAERLIEIETGTIIGSQACPTSVTAPFIRIMSSVMVHGTVWARKQGIVMSPIST